MLMRKPLNEDMVHGLLEKTVTTFPIDSFLFSKCQFFYLVYQPHFAISTAFKGTGFHGLNRTLVI